MMESVSNSVILLLTLTVTVVSSQYTIPVLRSCAELKLAGYSINGEYRIDPDGPGLGLPGFTVYCDMDEDFTVVEHNQMLHGIVPEDFEDSGEFRIPVTYRGGGSLQQVAKLADISANCSQYVRVDCYHVSLWYKGDIWGYWVSRDGSIMTNWGTPTGTRGCECSLDQSCDDPDVQTCNCDANDDEWRKDRGDLSDKSTLPVTELRFGDTGSEKEKIVYRLGALKCWGIDQQPLPSCDAWADAGFTGESDYLIQESGSLPRVEKCNEQFLLNPPPVLRSCEELKLAGYTSNDVYLIDPDMPSYGLNPFPVYCDMFSGTTLVRHDRLGPSMTKGYNGKGEHHIVVHYNDATLDQVAGLVDISSSCQQYISKECHDSTIWSSHRGNSQYTWWVSRNGTDMANWGTPTGTEGCACSLTNDCDRPTKRCNCDSNDEVWRQDDGYLTDKPTLPVRELRIGDTGSDDEVALYSLGELKCTGIDAVVYTSCDSLQVDGFTGAGYYLIDQDGSEGPNEPSLVKCDGNTEITIPVVTCPNVTRHLPQPIPTMSNRLPISTKMPRPSNGPAQDTTQGSQGCIEPKGKQSKAQTNSLTGGQGNVSISALNFVVVGVILLLVVVIVVLVIVTLQWKKIKILHSSMHMQSGGRNDVDYAALPSQQGETERPSAFSNVQFFNVDHGNGSADTPSNDYAKLSS